MNATRTYTAEELRALFHRKTLAGERHRGAVARMLKMSETEASALAHLARHGQLTPRQLGELLGLTSGGTTALVHRLEEAGHVTRRPHPRDRRSIILTPSASVLERAGSVYAPLVQEMDAVSARFSPGEREVIGRYMAEIAGVSERHAESLDNAARAQPDQTVAAPVPGLWA
ncbi:MAG: MarR family winged helix-turn-helix transcriptional regulator [Solirubrobacteraceae bacterium]